MSDAEEDDWVGPDTKADPDWPGRILRATLDALRERDAFVGMRLDRVTVGKSAILVELAADEDTERDPRRLAGIAHRPDSSSPMPPDDLADILAPIEGRGGEASLGARALAIATLNAASSPLVDWRTGDPMALLAPSVSRIVTVGLFRPAFRKFADVEVRVIERDPVAVETVATPASVSLRSFTPTETTAAMEGADVVFVTGSTLLYGGIERYLAAAPVAASVVVVGATASALPDPLFDRGGDVVAGAAIADPETARSAVADGHCGTDLHDRGVRKVYAARDVPETMNL
ncbi:Rossmann-like domain-containing protein [Halorubrum laminariae]|uniref:Rossmann-like domain-containing protein n=1 Tax=Halorubrum laminariae TaxID=1433523 RepID=A0ABD6C5F8_9EURY|nr:DUF364 domain-containing protein [Halorubrum laminariae]